MGNPVLLHILILSLSLFYKLENAKGRSLLVLTSAPVSLHSALSSASLLDDPLARANAPTKSQNLTDTGSRMRIDKESHHINKGLLLAIIILPIFVGCIMISSVCTWLYRKAYSSAPSSSQPHAFKRNLDPDTSDAYRGIPLMPLLNRLNSRISKKKGCATAIEYSKLQAATNNFSSNNILGEGGFGCVYKAMFDDDSFAAVKKLDEGSRQDEHEFQNEVELMSKIRHPNLVSFLGFCTHENTQFLVYDLMQNGSLEDQLHGPSHGSALTSFLRIKIALDSARGLEHLHEHCNPVVIHRDFKSSNILLDASFNAKAFFGVFDGHSGQKASNFTAENIGQNIVDAMLGMGDETENILEQAVRAGYLTTDTEFLKQEFGSSGCACVTALIIDGNLVVSNVVDCREVISRNGVYEALTCDHRAGREDARQRIENLGGIVDLRHGV